MKMKLLIVDDEKKIVGYLVNAINWGDFGFTEITTFTSSKDAILKLESDYVPDLLITDIRMPEVSGLDLVQKVGSQSKSIIISGYSDFEYAQKAIRYSAFDYLLKPIFPDELENVIGKVIKELSVEKITEGVPEIGFYLALLSGKIAENLSYLNILNKLIQRKYLPGLIRFGSSSILQFSWNHKTYGFSQHDGDIEESISGIQKKIFEDIFQLSIPESLADVEEFVTEVTERRWERLIQTLNIPMLDSDNAKNILTKLRVTSLLFETHPGIFENFSVSDVLNLGLSNNLSSFLCLNIEHGIKKLEDSNQTVLLVQDHVKKNLSASLSIEWLADKIHMHPVYLSRVYKQETGENLSQYILEQRLLKMKELLLSTDLRVKTITELVGYRKAQNVIEAFKKKYGHTPSQYRKIYRT